MSVSNDPVKHDFMQVRRLKLQHFVDARSVDLVCRSLHLFARTVRTAETRVDQLLAVFVQQFESGEVSAGRNLDELGKSVPNLRDGQGTQERKIKERMRGGMICAQSILVSAIVDSYFDADGSVDKANYGGGNADVRGVTAIGGTGEAEGRFNQPTEKGKS